MLLQGLLISLQKTYQGVGISAGLLQPEHKGGDKQDISIFGGYGDLDEDGFNIFGVVDYRRTNGIMAKDRKFLNVEEYYQNSVLMDARLIPLPQIL